MPFRRLPLVSWLAFPALVAAFPLVQSTRMLTQPFVWRNWGVSEIADAWLDLLRSHMLVALPVAIAVAVGCRILPTRPFANAAAVVVAAAIGGAIGHLVAGSHSEGGTSAAATMGEAARWALQIACLVALRELYRRVKRAQRAAIDTELRAVGIERELAQSRLAALRRQIEPHFLFNTLATVRRLHRTERDQGRSLLAQFLAYLRATMPDRQRESGSLGDEIDLLRAYLGIVVLRMSGRLAVEFDVAPDLLGYELPPFLLATLVENAVKHGIQPAPDGGTIRVSARVVDGRLVAEVADTGVGFGAAASSGTGIGLANIRERLATRYGSEARATLAPNAPRGVRAGIVLPMRVAA